MASSFSNFVTKNLVLVLLSSTLPAVVVRCDLPGGGSDVTKMLPCMEYMMRCQTCMNVPNPPAECCEGLMFVTLYYPECLCNILLNGQMLAYLNVSFDTAKSLGFRCGFGPPDIRPCYLLKIPTVKFNGNISHAGPSKRRIGFKEILTSIAIVLLVARMLIFAEF